MNIKKNFPVPTSTDPRALYNIAWMHKQLTRRS